MKEEKEIKKGDIATCITSNIWQGKQYRGAEGEVISVSEKSHIKYTKVKSYLVRFDIGGAFFLYGSDLKLCKSHLRKKRINKII